jgi:dTDP-4-amino-4,6-dideoxygalactose transaminase
MTQKLALHGGAPVRTQPYPVWPIAGDRERQLVEQVLSSDHWGGYHPLVTEFENLFAHLHDCEYGVTAANGSVALEMALHAAGIAPGDEVIVPAHSFIATASAVSRLGAIPVFVDIERETYNIDPIAIAAAASPKTKAVIPVHFGGVICDMERIERVAGQKSLRIIEDAAHAHGAEWTGKRAGGMGIAGAFSFQNSKVMTAGEGGIVITKDEDFAARARSFANCGRRPGQGWFDHFELAANYRLSALQAAVLLAQLERLGDQIRLRQRNAKILRQAVAVPGIVFQAVPKKANVDSLYLLVGRIDEKLFGVGRDEFVRSLEAEGIPCGSFYGHPLYKNPMYEALDHRVEPCPVAEQACRDSFWLPLRTLMGSEEDTGDIARAIEKIYLAVISASTRASPSQA